MLEFLQIGFLAVLLVSILTRIFWAKANFDWLQNICKFLIWSLPFEFFPRVEIAGAGFRISQFLVLIGFWTLAILVAKKDLRLLNHKLKLATWLPVGFLILSSPSWFLVEDFRRFFVHMFGTILVIGAMILILNFAKNIWNRLKELTGILVGCSLFGLYQFVGDMIGIPPQFTGLREHYTKAVFGIPRIQGTAVEPLYFAGMLVIALVVLTVCVFQNQCLFSGKIKENLPNKIVVTKPWKLNLFLLGIVLLTFILTLSKGSFAVLALLVPFFVLMSYLKLESVQNFVKIRIVPFALAVIILVLGLVNFTDPVQLFGSVGQNFVETLAGTSASAVERGKFVSEAVAALPKNLIQGIGMGQYADYVGQNLGNLNEDGKAIVNNVYVEVWLENGILALVWFLILIFWPLWKTSQQVLFQSKSLIDNEPQEITTQDIQTRNVSETYQKITPNNLAKFCLCFILAAYLLQWTLFSPIFIMPIFIILGMTYNLTNKA